MSTPATTEGLLRELAPQVLGAVARRYGDFADAEDAVQEALVAAASAWPTEGLPDNPTAWLIRVASRRMTDKYRQDEARRRREEVAASWSMNPPDAPSSEDDTLILVFMCCHPSLTPGAAIPLTLRAVGGLTTREIANAFLVPEATMAQRISRAKATIKASSESFALPAADERGERMRSVLHVLYLLFNEGYSTTSGAELARADLSDEAIRLTRSVHAALPEDAELTGLLALMLLTDARRTARTGASGELVPLAEQDRSLWRRDLISEGVALITEAMRRGQLGEYQVQAAIAAVHDQAPRHADTNWGEILALYNVLERMTANPMITLNRAVATAMVHGPDAGLALLDGLDAQLGDHHRLHSVRAHLLELSGDTDAAVVEFRAAAAGTTNLREREFLTMKAARIATQPSILVNPSFRPDRAGSGAAGAERSRAFHRRLPGYAPTRVVDAPGLASELGVAALAIKDESRRLEMPSFKILGASWAVYQLLVKRLGREPGWDTVEELRAAFAPLGALALVAATDGNHGRAVARMAKLLGYEATILVPAGTVAARVDGIASEGAQVIVVDGTYDDAVLASAALATDRALVVSDTSWEGYTEVPRTVIEGYETIFAELDEQLASPPELVVIPMGVGALAAAAVAHYAERATVAVVEPLSAACGLRSAAAGHPVEVAGPHDSIMAGLNCGTVSPVAWPAVSRGTHVFVAVDDRAAERAMRDLAAVGIVAGETGAAALAGLRALTGANEIDTRDQRALVLCTEGATDPAAYRRIVGREP